MCNIEFIRDRVFIREVVFKPRFHLRCTCTVCIGEEIIDPSVPSRIVGSCVPSELTCEVFFQRRPTRHCRVGIVVYGVHAKTFKQAVIDAHTVKAVVRSKKRIHIRVIRPNEQVVISNAVRAVLTLVEKACPVFQILPSRSRFPCRSRIVHRQGINREGFRKPYVDIRIEGRFRLGSSARRVIRKENHAEGILTGIVIIL